jgi:hypothetical protein
MRKIVAVVILAVLVSLGASGPASASSSGDMQGGAAGAALAARASFPGVSGLSGVERLPLTEDVAHYRFELAVGSGEHDVIRLHRVVRERAPWVPERAERGAFLVHGDGWGFEPTFLASEEGMALHLAEGGVDVWGIDFRWVLVPGDTSDLSFMAGWGLATQLGDLDLGLTVARATRTLTGGGPGRLNLVGFSRGGQLGWAQAGAETARPPSFRHLRGLVSIENAFKHADEALRLSDCAGYASTAAALDGGTFASDFRIVADVGDLATAAPEEPSPLFPILSNADLAEWLGASVGGGAIPHFHSVGGVVDPATLVTELLYTEPAAWFSFLSGVSAFQPLRINLDGAGIGCDELDSPFDDHLAEIEIPVLYVGVGGAFGELGVHTTTLVASPTAARSRLPAWRCHDRNRADHCGRSRPGCGNARSGSCPAG